MISSKAKPSPRTALRIPPHGAGPITDDPRVATLLRALKSDPHLAPVVQEFEERAKRSGGGGRKFGANAMKVNGKLFALFTEATVVVKLPKARVAELLASQIGTAFDPGHGRLMTEWLTVTHPNASWAELVREAYAFVKERGH